MSADPYYVLCTSYFLYILNSALKRVDSYGLNINRFNAIKKYASCESSFFPLFTGSHKCTRCVCYLFMYMNHSMLTFPLNNTDDYDVLVNEVLRSKTYT